jgi:hypothetical protein
MLRGDYPTALEACETMARWPDISPASPWRDAPGVDDRTRCEHVLAWTVITTT